MGKVKLKSSLRSLQIALSKLRATKLNEDGEEGEADAETTSTRKQIPRLTGWSFSCGQPSTHSFRVSKTLSMSPLEAPTENADEEENVYKSFNSLYIVSDLRSSATAHSLFPLVEEEEECCPKPSNNVIICDEKGRIFADNSSCSRKFTWDAESCWFLDEEETSVELEFTSKSSNYSSDFSSSDSSRSTDFVAGVVRGLSSQRFFFSPGSSNSILEESKCHQIRHTSLIQKDNHLDGRDKIDMASAQVQPHEEAEAGTDLNVCTDMNNVKGDDGGESMLDLSSNLHNIYKRDSVAMRMYSIDPYLDFKISMQEMIEAHNLTDWSCLQELLCCYLNLNNKKTHKFIMGAFNDLVVNLIATNRTSVPLSLEFASSTH